MMPGVKIIFLFVFVFLFLESLHGKKKNVNLQSQLSGVWRSR